MNLPVIFLTALVPLLIGFIWYHEKVFGKAWMKASGMTPELAAGSNMLKTFGLTYVFGLFVTMIMYALVVHQTHLQSLIVNQPDYANPASEAGKWYADTMAMFGDNYRTFKHGMFHGLIGGIMLSFPLIGVPALFERKSAAYILINAGFWVVTFMIIGGIICQFG